VDTVPLQRGPATIAAWKRYRFSVGTAESPQNHFYHFSVEKIGTENHIWLDGDTPKRSVNRKKA
jgi:hypothetical protein